MLAGEWFFSSVPRVFLRRCRLAGGFLHQFPRPDKATLKPKNCSTRLVLTSVEGILVDLACFQALHLAICSGLCFLYCLLLYFLAMFAELIWRKVKPCSCGCLTGGVLLHVEACGGWSSHKKFFAVMSSRNGVGFCLILNFSYLMPNRSTFCSVSAWRVNRRKLASIWAGKGALSRLGLRCLPKSVVLCKLSDISPWLTMKKLQAVWEPILLLWV